jgi:hypothetical protein
LVTFSTLALQAAQVMPVTVNFCFMESILRSAFAVGVAAMAPAEAAFAAAFRPGKEKFFAF